MNSFEETECTGEDDCDCEECCLVREQDDYYVIAEEMKRPGKYKWRDI